MYYWKVVPLCEEQLLDIDPKDVLPGGHFRLCDVYKSGGGYDKFPAIFEKRTGKKTSVKQFVVQLYGCHLKCPYCYVTPNGIWGKPIYYHTDALAKAFFTTQEVLNGKLEVFHLMGGSPALYLEHWPELIDRLGEDVIFHSDLCLTEKVYDRKILRDIARPNCLYAVNIKGTSYENYRENTGCEADDALLYDNLYSLVVSKVPFYLTFTNPGMNYYQYLLGMIFLHCGNEVLEDSFIIDLVDYDAIKAYKGSSLQK